MRTLAAILLSLATASAAGAQGSGLLLGLSSDSGVRTLWVAPVGGTLNVAARMRGLIVPRNDGFHHLGIVRWCSLRGSGDVPNSGPFYDDTDTVVDLPVGSAPAHPDAAHLDCAAADSIVRAADDSLRRVAAAALAVATTEADSGAATRDQTESYSCFSRKLQITHAGPHFLSVYYEEGSGENCAPGRETWSSHRMTTRDGEPADLLPLLPKARAARIEALWRTERGECAVEQSPDESWGIVRALGRWQLAFAASGATVCAGRSGSEEEGFSIEEPVPASVARRDPADRWLPAVRHIFPVIDDIFVSPTGDLVVVRTGSRLTAFLPRNGAPGVARLEVPLRPGETVVMAEWATSRHVDDWTRQLQALHERW